MGKSKKRVGRPKKVEDLGSDAPEKGRSESPKKAKSPLLRSLGLAGLSGVLYFTAFPGIDIWPLAFIALVPLFFALDAQPVHSNRRVIGIGLWFGLVTNLGGYYWLVGMLEDFSGFPYVACVGIAALLCGAQGGLLALFSWLWFRARSRGYPALLVGPLAFMTAELVYPLLFPSYYSNHFHNQPALIQIADLGGPILITGLAVLINAALYDVLRAAMRRERLPWKEPALAAALVGLTLGYGAYRINQVDDAARSAPSVTVGMVQTNMGIFDKRQDPVEGLRRHIDMSLALDAEANLDLLVWPESAYSFFVPEDLGNVKRHVMGAVTTPLIFGGLARRTVAGEERHYNTAFLADGDGTILGNYDKTFLLAFGEYLPLGDVFPILYDWSPHSGRFTKGDHVRPLEWGDYRISALICYEDIVPRFVRTAMQEADPHLLVNITNDAWFGDTSEPWQHLALAKMRSVEQHRYLVRSTNSGVSAIIDPVGRTVVQSGVLTPESLHADVRMMTGTTVYRMTGDWAGWLSLLGVLWMGFYRKRTKASP